MNKITRTLVLAATVAATVFATTAPAVQARDREWREGDAYYLKHRKHHRHHGGRDAVVGGALGLATGLIIGGAIASSQPRYVEPDVYVEPDYYPEQRVYRRAVVVPTYEPWTQSWYRYCSQRYRSFDPQTGTYVGYDGLEHFCVAS